MTHSRDSIEQPQVLIRPAQHSDADVIASLGDTAQRTYAALLPEFYNCMDRSYWHSRFLRSLSLRDYFIFVAELCTADTTLCAGYIELFIKRTTSPLVMPRLRLLVDNLVVDVHCRNRGIGRQLLAYADAFAAERGIDTVELQVAAHNTAAMHLYQSHGFSTRSLTLEKKLHSNNNRDSLSA